MKSVGIFNVGKRPCFFFQSFQWSVAAVKNTGTKIKRSLNQNQTPRDESLLSLCDLPALRLCVLNDSQLLPQQTLAQHLLNGPTFSWFCF